MTVWSQADRRLVISFGLLLAFGLIMLSSASSALGFDRFGDAYYYVKRQIFSGLLPGLLLGYIVLRGGHRLVPKLSLPLFILCLILLGLVFVPGIGQTYGTFARRWIDLGPISFQPSELAKLAVVAYLAAWLSSHQGQLGDFKKGFLPFVGIVGLVVGLIILEPDMGTAGVIVMTTFLMYFIANGSLRYMFLLGAGGLFLLSLLIVAEPYRLERLKTFVDPSRDPLGAGYHVQQSFLAIGSGGMWGRGLGASRSKFQYLPEVTGDSIFPVIAEELGFWLSAALCLLYLYFFSRIMRVAENTKDNFYRFLVAGIGIWIATQTFINLGSMVGMLPLTGVPLPFISYGGTSLMMAIVGICLVIRISADNAGSPQRR
jgi:cell division protein FtsW